MVENGQAFVFPSLSFTVVETKIRDVGSIGSTRVNMLAVHGDSAGIDPCLTLERGYIYM